MSYSAFVTCNCYKDGLTTEPPYKDLVSSDDQGVCLMIPDELWERDKEIIYQMDRQFDQWKLTACEHPDMYATHEYLCNISGMADFKYIIDKLGGRDRFPVLTEYLPVANGGTLPTEYAAEALQELQRLESEALPEEYMMLRDESSGELIASTNSNTYFLFVFTAYNKYNYGIDKGGFFILENTENNGEEISYVKFRSTHFQQQTLSAELYRFIDLATGKFFECSARLNSGMEDTAHENTYIVTREEVLVANYYAYILVPLKKLASASIQTGNPIVWT